VITAQYLPQLHHLHLRYCRRITDAGVNAIAHNMKGLYSLDLSFCTQVTISAIVNLLEIRGDCLAELRLMGCKNLDIPQEPDSAATRLRDRGRAGRQLVNAVRSHGSRCCLSVLDVRNCGVQHSIHTEYHKNDPFVRGMSTLLFAQKAPGFFSRPARWNRDIERRLVKQALREKD
jgi:Leucine Rich repeat